MYYPGEDTFLSINTLLGVTISLVDFLAGLIEIVRAGLHTFFPYQSHTEVSGLADAIGLEGKTLDAVAMITFQYGIVSWFATALFWAPFIRGDPFKQDQMFNLAFSFLVRAYQLAEFRINLFTNPAV